MSELDSALSLIVQSLGNADVEPLHGYLRSGGNPDVRYRGRGLLHWCAQESSAEGIRLPVSAGARPEEEDEHGHFPLHQAAADGSLGIVRVIVEAGGVVNHRTRAGTALGIACACEQIDVVRYLRTAGGDPHLADEEGSSAWFHALEYDSPELIEVWQPAGPLPEKGIG